MNDNEKYIEEFVKDIPFDAPDDEHRDKLKKQLLSTFPKHRLQPTVHTVHVWRNIMKSSTTRVAVAAAVIIIAVLLSIGIFDFDIVATPAYAFEQTIEANHTIKTIQFRMFEGEQSIENNEFSDYWIKYNAAGKLSNLRCDERNKDGIRFIVWNEGIKKTWIPKYNVVIFDRQNNTSKDIAKKWEDFAKECNPRLFLQWIYDQAKENEEIEIKIDETAEDSESIYVKATGRRDRVEMVVDRKTKFVKTFSFYQLKKQQYKFILQVEFLAYNQSIDPSRFELREIPDDAKIIDKLGDIIPGLRVGDYTLGMSKDDVLKKLGEPRYIHYGGERYTLDNLPRMYYLSFEHISFKIVDDSVQEFGVRSSLYKFTNGLGVGDSEQKIKQAFGNDFQLEESESRDFLDYEDKGIQFEINKEDRTVEEINIGPIADYYIDNDVLNPQEQSKHTILPGMGVGDYKLGMSKDDVLRKLGEPDSIQLGEDEVVRRGEEKYNLNNLPREYFMAFGHVSFMFHDESVGGIFVRSPLYKLSNGLKVGDSEQKIKQAFGDDFHLREGQTKNILNYEDKGIQFEIYTMNGMVVEIGVYQPEGDNGDSDTPDSGKEGMLSEQPPGPIIFPKIDKDVIPEPWHRGTLNELPPSISEEFFQIDLKSYDLSSLDLRNSLYELLHSNFDSSTIWPAPDKMPKGFDLNKIMKYGKNPGLNVKSLHSQGITGKNMGIAIIDQVLLAGHEEYRDRLRLYEEVHIPEYKTGADSHASGMASVAAGTSIGVAPEADLYFIGCYFWEWENHSNVVDFKYIAQAVRRIIAINRQLPNDRKIQAISISRGFNDTHKGYDEIVAACYEAKAEGLFVVCCSMELLYNNFDFHALGRDPLGNPNDFNSYRPGNWWEQEFYNYPDRFNNEVLLVPSGSRVKASDTGHGHYVFSVGGGLSSVVPYVAGLYVLAKQVNSEITPEQFCSKALQTSRTIELDHNGKKIPFGPIIDPVRLIHRVSRGLKQ